MPSNTTDRNQNARQTAQDDTSTVRSLTSRSTDYHRLPKALRAIVDAYAMLDLASDHMGEASEAARSGDLRPADRPDERMLFELRSLVEHTLWEIRRHGVIEGALAWLASHPEGWDDEPERAEDVGDVPDAEGEAVRTRDCHGCKRQFQPGDLCEQWAHTFSSAAPVRSLCADCSWPAAPAKRLKDGGYALRIGYTVPGNVTYAGDRS